MRTQFIKLFLLVSIFVLFTKLSYSQSSSNHIYEMNYLTIPAEQIDDFLKFYEEYGKPLDSQNEYVLSVKVFTHVFGPSWNVAFLTEYKDFDAFTKGRTRGDELFEKMFTDKTKMTEISNKFAKYLTGHTDALVLDHPELSKTSK